MVVISAAAFGVALFGRRPLPQRAMAGDADPLGSVVSGNAAETTPSLLRSGQVTVARVPGVDSPVLIHPPHEPGHLDLGEVRVPSAVRVRSAVLLALGAIGVAVLLGAILSIVVVGAVLLIA